MFWGLIMEPGRCYTQKVKVSFHVSMASLDISNSTDEPAQVMCVFEGRNYLLCTLKKRDMVQCPLDLNFEAGTKVSFATNGKAHVHLTGYLTNFDDDSLLDVEEEQEEEETTKEKKRPKKELNEGPPSKKSKTVKNSASEDAEEEESSDSDIDKLMLEDDDEDESDEDYEEQSEEDAEEEEVEDEDASSLSEKEEETEEKKPKPKQNGIAKAPEPKKKEQKEKAQEKTKTKAPKPKKTVLKGGVMVEDVKEGTGEAVKEGKFVHVYYEGRLKDNNKMFDSTTKGPGFSFRVGKGEVIKGWDIGLVGMKVGGKRRITCPPKTAYGSQGSPPVIPPNSTLIFDVELKKIS